MKTILLDSAYVAVNSTMSAIPGLGNGTSWFASLVVVFFGVMILSLLIMAISSVSYFKKLKGFIGFMVRSFYYFLTGIAALIVIAIPVGLFWWEFSNASKGNVAPLSWTVYIVGGYAVVAFIGYLAKRLIARIKKLNKKAPKLETGI